MLPMFNDAENYSNQEWKTLTGLRYHAVRFTSGAHWLVTRGLIDGRLPLAIHLQLLEGVDRGDPGAVRAMRGRSIDLPRLSKLSLTVALIATILCVFLLGKVVSTGENSPSDAVRLLLGGIIVSYLCQLFIEALVVRSELGGNEHVMRMTMFGPRIEPVVWLLLESKWVSFISLLTPMIFGLVGISRLFPEWFGLGIASISLLRLAIRTCPFKHGPVAALLGRSRGISDYPRFLRMSLASWLVPNGKNIVERTRATLASGAVMAVLWVMLCLGGFALFQYHAQPTQMLDWVWMRFWEILFGLFVIWCVNLAVHLFIDALHMRTKGRVSLTIPDQTLVRRWKEGCALLLHAPGLSQAHWEWFKVEPGCPLIRFGQMEAAFWWVATGSLEKITRNHKGNEVPEGIVRAGSAFATGLMKEQLVSSVEWIAMEPTVLCKLSSSHLDTLNEETKRKAQTFIQISNSFDRCSVLSGMHPVLKEIWLSKGRLIWVPGGTVLMEVGEEATWMGLLVQGSLRKENAEDLLLRDQLLGQELLSYEPRRNSTLITSEVSLIMRWEYSWLRQWIPQSSEREVEQRSEFQFQH